MAAYSPRQGDVIALSFDPQSGHEQKGRRPALVVSNTLFNKRVGLAFVCPITSTDRGFPFHVAVPAGMVINGFVMVEQLKSVDFRSRRAKRIARCPAELLDEVLSLVDACLFTAE